MVALLMPFSKRALDSLRKLCFCDARRTALGSNRAASNKTVVVSSEISVSNPPITPANATGLAPEVITISFSSVRSSPSKVTNVSSSVARRTWIAFSGNLS